MHFSCKISNAVLNILEEQGEDLSLLYDDQTHLPLELMRDPSYWISAPDMEEFLRLVLRLPLKNSESLLERAGHDGPQLRSWGVLDSVLRMMPRPQEIFNNPEQFLSYFISPKPPVENLRRQDDKISFDLPLSAEQYPLVTTYLKAAFESLPVYVGQPLAKCEWTDITIQMTWADKQESFVEEASLGHQVSPALFQSLIDDLQNTQREREDLQKYVNDLEARLHDLEKQTQTEGSKSPNAQDSERLLIVDDVTLRDTGGDSSSYVLNQNLARMHDYMVRAQQLITMLLGQQNKMPAGVKEAMRRMDWEHVKTQYPRTVFESMEVVKKMHLNNSEQEGK